MATLQIWGTKPGDMSIAAVIKELKAVNKADQGEGLIAVQDVSLDHVDIDAGDDGKSIATVYMSHAGMTFSVIFPMEELYKMLATSEQVYIDFRKRNK